LTSWVNPYEDSVNKFFWLFSERLL